MSLDPTGAGRSSSPASSDASQAKATSRVHEDGLLKKDKGYRRYASNVERALSLFDTALQEWADYISFLSRLLKALQSHPPSVSTIPNKAVVAKRLAQCLNPALPSGVHQKALEVYGYIFALLKPDGLAHDLSLYLPGIAPTLTFASLTVRPIFLSLVETYIVGLDPARLRPALKAVILSLLPGLEEETSDDFDTALRIVDKLRQNTQACASGTNRQRGGEYFWQCLFLASITNPTRRMGVLAYLNRRLPKLGGNNPWATLLKETVDAELARLAPVVDSLTSPEPGLLVRCFATGLNDEQLLVQRNFLDLLVIHLPLHSPILQERISANDLRLLVTATAGVVTRRDMSLNRRLWAWFLGPESTNEMQATEDDDSLGPTAGSAADAAFDNESSQSKYFAHFGLKPLVQSLQTMIQRDSLVPTERSKPFRMSLSLMDRWEVGGLVVPEIFLPVMRSVQKYRQVSRSNAQFEEVFRSASAFFDGVESSLIFSELLGLVRLNSPGHTTISASLVEDLKLAHFIVSHFNMREEEMLVTHIPLLILALLLKMRAISSMDQDASDYANMRQVSLDEIFSIVNRLFNLVPGRAFTRIPNKADSGSEHIDIPEAQMSGVILDFYERSKASLEHLESPLSPSQMAELLLQQAHSLALSALESEVQLKERFNLLISILDKAPRSSVFIEGKLYQTIFQKLRLTNSASQSLPFPMLSCITSAVTTLYSIQPSGLYLDYQQISDIIPRLVPQLWEYLSPLSLSFHVEAVRCIWLLHSISWQDHFVEASIASLMVTSSTSRSSHTTTRDQAERFFVLWGHSNQVNIDYSLFRISGNQPRNSRDSEETKAVYQSSLLVRPLFIVLDQLSFGAEDTSSSSVKEWLQDLPSVRKVFSFIFSKLRELGVWKRGNLKASADQTNSNTTSDVNQCYYLFRTLSNIISSLGHNGWSALTSGRTSDSESHATVPDADGSPEVASLQKVIVQSALVVLRQDTPASSNNRHEKERMRLEVLYVLKQLLSGPGALDLVYINLDNILIEQLESSLDSDNASLQAALLDALLPALRARFSHDTSEMSLPSPKHRRKSSLEALSPFTRRSVSGEKPEVEHTPPIAPQPNPQLLQCILKGISSRSSRDIIDKWIDFLVHCLPLYSGSIFQVLLTLVEHFCKEVNAAYQDLQRMFQGVDGGAKERSEHVTVALLTGLENCIATAHARLIQQEANVPVIKTPEQPQSFFGNMVSGVFATESAQSHNVAGSDRLTVLLCFQDAVRLCFAIWSWGNHAHSRNSVEPDSVASFQYTSLRMRNRSRRMLEHLFTAEPLECLETAVQLWRHSNSPESPTESRLVFNLLHTLDGSRPKITIPAVFNAIYSRTNPSALEPSRKSAMASQLSETELALFLVTYARSLEDDVMDEIWADCTTFLRDVLANPFPHRRILLRLLEFAAILGEKMENTSFGDDRRARKELGELLLRVLTAIFTSKPASLSQESRSADSSSSPANDQQFIAHDDILGILSSIMPSLTTTLGDSDRVGSAMSGISLNVVSPLIHSRLFPQNVPKTALDLVQQMSKIPSAAKHWKKDVGEAFNDPKFFGTKPSLVKSNWLALLRQWIIADKDRMADLLARLSPPTSAGIMFGVGASAARLEADRKTQSNLRRISLLVLATDEDHFSSELSALQQKLEDVLTATHVSSPSSATRAETYMVLRSVILKTSSIHLAPFWPMINMELREVLSAVASKEESEIYNPYSLLQACKLLETLLIASPDDFQLQEWLFVTDTIDVIYPPERWESSAIADEVSKDLGARISQTTSQPQEPNYGEDGYKRSWLNTDKTRETPKDEIVDKVLRPFFDRLSIHAFESTYSMCVPDLVACKDDLLADLFNEFTMAS